MKDWIVNFLRASATVHEKAQMEDGAKSLRAAADYVAQGEPRPNPVAFTFIEGGHWIPWDDPQRPTSNGPESIRIHSIRFEDGSEFDALNGWRDKIDTPPISSDEVERAARAIYEYSDCKFWDEPNADTWDTATEYFRRLCRKQARKVLEAARLAPVPVEGREELSRFKHELFALCEDTETKYAEIAERDAEGKQGAFARGRIIEAKSIRKAMGEVFRLAAAPEPPRSAGGDDRGEAKWFDPECGQNGCQSLVWKARYESAVRGRSDFRQALSDARVKLEGDVAFLTEVLTQIADGTKCADTASIAYAALRRLQEKP